MTREGGPRPSPGAEHAPAAGTPPALPVVVGLGASAGGLDALKKFFAALPAQSGLAYVVVVHLSPSHDSHLAELLRAAARIPVEQVTDSVPLEADRVYVIPPGMNLAAVDSHLRLSPIQADRAARAPIDHFFRTLAETHDGAAIGVILSGTGTDGSDGVRHIREHGGLVIVQDPEEAEYDGMPRSAINAGFADLVVPAGEMPARIARFMETRPQLPVTEEPAAEGDRPDALQQVLTVLRLRTGQDFLRYKRSTISRRVARRMQVCGVQTLEQYLELLRENGREAAALLDDVLINVTRFFRDEAVFGALETDVIPRLFANKGAADRVRVWSVGCATGEEAYSLAMLLLEEAMRHPTPPQVQVFASDLQERALRIAREGLYPEAIAVDVTPERLQRFFRREEGGYRITKPLRDAVVFATHNLLQDPPFSHLDLIVCRNLLIYLQPAAQRQAIGLFHYALQDTGYLLLGPAETLERTDLFRMEQKAVHLYRRRHVARSEVPLPDFPTPVAGERPRRSTPIAPSVPAREGATPGYGAVHLRMLERHAPPSLLLDPDENVVHLSEEAGRFLQHPAGIPTTSVFRLVREELRLELRATLLAAREQAGEARSRPVAMRLDGQDRLVFLRVTADGEGDLEGLVLVLFEELEPASLPGVLEGGTQEAVVRGIEAELDLTRNRLQAILEEFETSREEMRASNEELQSANEELRSTMEELETSREELQSINEELETANQENKHKVEELSHLTNDLQNFLQATDVATLFLDRSLRILRYTRGVNEIFNVRHSDRGRPLADLTHRLRYDELIADARHVLQSLERVEREAVSQDGAASYVVRLSPYRTMDDRIEGVVITVVEVTALKRTEDALRASEARFRAVANLVPDLLWQSAADGTTSWYNDRWYAYTGQNPEQAAGSGWTEVVHPDDRDSALLEWTHTRGQPQVPFRREHRLRAADGSYRWFLVRAEPLRDDAGPILGWLGAATDVHEQRLAIEEVERRVSERTQELARANAALEAAATERNLLRRQLTAAEEDERRRLARELHDQLGQHLTAFALGLAEVRRLLRAGHPAAARLEQLEGIARVMTKDARYLALELRPPELDDVGLQSAIETYVRAWASRYGLVAEVAITGLAEGTIRGEVGTATYRILQEALTNVAKHARATHVSVTVDRGERELRMTIEDDGRGFDVAAALSRAPAEQRLGLLGMNERAALAGGTATVESTPGTGTSVFVRILI